MSDHLDVTTLAQPAVLRGKIARRGFLRTTGRLAVAAPAVVLLMSATSKGAMAQSAYENVTGIGNTGT